MSNFFQTAVERLLASLTGLEHEGVEYIETRIVPILKADVTKTLIQIAPIAEQAVLQVATSGKPGADKFTDAKAIVVAGAKSAGIDVATELLNGAIQTAYDKLNALKQLPAATPTGSATGNQSVPVAPAAAN